MATFKWNPRGRATTASFRKVDITIGDEGWRQQLVDACKHETKEVKMIYAVPLPSWEEFGEEVEVWETVDYPGWLDFLEERYSEIYGVRLSRTIEFP